MDVRAWVRWAPKAGHEAAEYEDAYALPESGGEVVRAAVADGATESAFARPWAEVLARGYRAEGAPGADALADRLPAWRRAWAAAVAPRLRDLPWYAAAKADEGAYAALLGLTLASDGTWHALSVGDACLFHLRRGEPAATWPFADADAFTHRPALLATRADAAPPPVATRAGAWAVGDVFVLATDALAAWLFRVGPATACGLTEADFSEAVAAARAAGTLRNDDVTLVVLEVAG